MKLPLASGSIAKFCNVTNSCFIKLPDNFNKIFFKLSTKLNDQQNRTDSISILDFDNKIYLYHNSEVCVCVCVFVRVLFENG